MSKSNNSSDVDETSLENELDAYQLWLDEKTEHCYQIAEKARQRGLDHQTFVEIPRASDLASRTEKLLVDYLEGIEVADDIRVMLAEHDRETTSIRMAQKISKRFFEEGYDLEKSVDVGVRVGLAILTEAVLVAPLEGISEVRLLHNVDGSQFVSVHFAGPIRAAGGTAQALAVLIADMVRRELGINRYIPTTPEVERVKEEFGLYRGNLQYRPPPEEIETIVRACPVMVNGESTESIECSGYGECRNVDEARVRGGVLLVIGEGLCLKAPKIQKHTERLEVAGWEFIAEFAEKGAKKEGDGDSWKRKKVKPIAKYMKDIIAGRPVFGEPCTPGAFRLKYGRARPSGLAAASLNPSSMVVMDDFLAVGTQMKIERPGKACAVTPCDEAEGPWIILRDGRFLRMDDVNQWPELKEQLVSIWDNGEIVLGYGEFLENNKNLVPAAYCGDWWASELIDKLDSEGVKKYIQITGKKRNDLPNEIPVGGSELVRRKWHQFLRNEDLNWKQTSAVCTAFATALVGAHNLWWADLPVEWVEHILPILEKAKVENDNLCFTDAVKGWKSRPLEILQAEKEEHEMPGKYVEPPAALITNYLLQNKHLKIHGMAKATALILGIAHHHEGDDLILTNGWQALLHGFGFSWENGIKQTTDCKMHLKKRISRLSNAANIIAAEKSRLSELNAKRSTVKIAAETEARQIGDNIEETDRKGRVAMEGVPDSGPEDADALRAAQILEDDHAFEGVMWLVRKISPLRHEHAAPTRIGTRMARPEKAAQREMKPMSHSLFPIELTGGNQRRLDAAAEKGSLRTKVGVRECSVCGRSSPMISCHHPANDRREGNAKSCGGRTEPKNNSQNANSRRQGVHQTLPLLEMTEEARRRLNIDRLPKLIKCRKTLNSKSQTPEALEKGILRAMNSLPVFRDGTIRFDMSDIPITHFKPIEIGVPFEKLIELGYSHDIEGSPLNNNSQMLELYPQDFIAGRGAGEFFLRVSKYIDMLLEKYYGQPAFYKCEEINDLVGHLIIALAPHTSGGVLSRIVGWSQSSGGYAHPLFHASKRRNCFEGGTEINIINNNKSIVISLKELIDNKISLEGLVSDDFGTMMCDATAGLETISLDTNNQTPITLPITKFIKGKTNSWIEIETSSGRKIKVTPDHQVLITKSGMMVNVMADEIKLGDEVLISSNNANDIMQNISVDNNSSSIGKNQHTFNEIITNIEVIEVDNEDTYCIDIDSGSSELISKNILLANGMYQIRCDGDEDAIMLLMDGLLNFSKSILPANRGGQMDAPLVLTTKLNPTEVDKEALNVDCAWYYPVSFYEATQKQPHPKEVAHLMDFVEKRLDSPRSRRDYGYTHDCISMDAGPSLSAYKTLESMVDKMNGQLELGRKLRAVDVRNVASSVVRSHFLPDLRGNLVAFTRQKIRCLKCGKSYRRMPLAGKCIETGKGKSKGAERVGSGLGIKVDNNRQCGGKLALTVTEGAVRKYIKVTEHVMDTYGLDNYTKQNMEWLAKSVESLFNNDRARQASLFDFL